MEVSAQWLAGFFDGEGCIAFRVHSRKGEGKHKTRVNAACTITHTHLPTLKAIVDTFGGHIYKHKGKYYSNRHMSKIRQGWMLYWHTQEEVARVLTAIQPYAVTKKDQVDFFLAEFVPTMKTLERAYQLTDEQHSKRFEVRDKIAIMKSVEFTGTVS